MVPLHRLPATPCRSAYAASAAVNPQVLAATAAESWLATPATYCGLMLLTTENDKNFVAPYLGAYDR